MITQSSINLSMISAIQYQVEVASIIVKKNIARILVFSSITLVHYCHATLAGPTRHFVQ